jgi:hypothetical protein
MGFFSGSTANVPIKEQRPMGLSAQRLSTAEQARPLPVVWGRNRLGITYISNPINQYSEPVTQEVGKKSEGVTSGYNYFCSFAALVCHGLVEALEAIYFDDEKVWPINGGPITRQPGENYATITIAEYGTWRFYWGTETQDIDPLLAEMSSDENPESPNVAEEHPAYTGQCYMVAIAQFLGYNRTSAPNIEVVVSRYPEITWMDPPTIPYLADCSIPALICEAATNKRYGLGLSEDILDQSLMAAVLQALYAEGLGISPVLSESTSFHEFLVAVLEYIDGFYYFTENGKLAIGLNRKVECNDESIPVIDEECLTDLPEIDVTGATQTRNEVRVTFTNDQAEWKEDSTQGSAAGAVQTVGAPNSSILSRPWITSVAMADRVALASARALAIPRVQGRIAIRKSKLQGIGPGDPFYFNYDQYAICWMHCRAIDVSQNDPDVPEIEITFEEDRGYVNNQVYTGPVYVAPQKAQSEPEALAHQAVIELPFYKLAGEVRPPYLSALASRPNSMTTRATVSIDWQGAKYVQVGEVRKWAVHGTIDSGLDEIETLVTVTVDSEYDSMPSEIGGETWLCIIGDEIMTIDSDPMAGSGNYSFTVTRGAFDSASESHSASAGVFIIKWNDLLINSFGIPFYVALGDTMTFKLTPYVLGKAYDGAFTYLTVDNTERVMRPWKPDDLTGPTTYDGTETQFQFSWTATNRWGSALPRWGVNPVWEMVVHKSTESFDYTNPRANALFYDLYAYNETTATVSKARLLAAMDPLESFTIRLYARMDGYLSRHYETLEVAKV